MAYFLTENLIYNFFELFEDGVSNVAFISLVTLGAFKIYEQCFHFVK